MRALEDSALQTLAVTTEGCCCHNATVDTERLVAIVVIRVYDSRPKGVGFVLCRQPVGILTPMVLLSLSSTIGIHCRVPKGTDRFDPSMSAYST